MLLCEAGEGCGIWPGLDVVFSVELYSRSLFASWSSTRTPHHCIFGSSMLCCVFVTHPSLHRHSQGLEVFIFPFSPHIGVIAQSVELEVLCAKTCPLHLTTMASTTNPIVRLQQLAFLLLLPCIVCIGLDQFVCPILVD